MKNQYIPVKIFILLILLSMAGVSLLMVYHAIVDWPGNQIVQAYMKTRGIIIQPGTLEYKIFMRQIAWGEIPELWQLSEFIHNQEELEAVQHYAFKYSGYLKGSRKLPEREVQEALPPPTSPTPNQSPSPN